MKILHINNFFNSGGSARACLEAARYLSSENVDQQFIGCVKGNEYNKFKNIGMVHLYKEPISGFDYPISWINQIVSEFNPDLIHIWLPGRESPKYFNGLPLKTPKIITVLCGQKIGFDYNMFNRVLFISQYNKSLNTFVDNGEVLRLGITEPAPEDPVLIESGPLICGRVSAICPSKKLLDTAYCAWLALKDKLNVSFFIAGEVLDESYYLKLWEFKHENNITNLELYRNVDDKIKRKLLSKIDLLHYPSINEAFCVSIVEAMARKQCVITYNTGAIPELNHTDNLVLCEDIVDLGRHTLQLLQDSERRHILGNKNYQVYLEHYRAKIYGAKLHQIYQKHI